MPWRACSVMEERLRFVARRLDGEAMSDVCREFGISRKTGYKIFHRYREEGLDALADRSRRPVRYANQLLGQTERLIVEAQARQAALGRAQDPGTAGQEACRRRADSRQEHRACRARSPRPGPARPRAQEPRPGHAPVGRRRPQRPLVRRLQGRVQARQRPLLLPRSRSPTRPRATCSCAKPSNRPAKARSSPPSSGSSANAACPSPSGATTGCPSPAPTASTTSPASRSGGSGLASQSSASSPGTRSRTAATNACI